MYTASIAPIWRRQETSGGARINLRNPWRRIQIKSLCSMRKPKARPFHHLPASHAAAAAAERRISSQTRRVAVVVVTVFVDSSRSTRRCESIARTTVSIQFPPIAIELTSRRWRQWRAHHFKRFEYGNNVHLRSCARSKRSGG